MAWQEIVCRKKRGWGVGEDRTREIPAWKE